MAALIMTDFSQFKILAAWSGAGALSSGVVWLIHTVYDMASPSPPLSPSSPSPAPPLPQLLICIKFFFFINRGVENGPGRGMGTGESPDMAPHPGHMPVSPN